MPHLVLLSFLVVLWSVCCTLWSLLLLLAAGAASGVSFLAGGFPQHHTTSRIRDSRWSLLLQVQRLALLSLLAVFQDILPAYRIRPPTGKELQVRVQGLRCMRCAAVSISGGLTLRGCTPLFCRQLHAASTQVAACVLAAGCMRMAHFGCRRLRLWLRYSQLSDVLHAGACLQRPSFRSCLSSHLCPQEGSCALGVCARHQHKTAPYAMACLQSMPG